MKRNVIFFGVVGLLLMVTLLTAGNILVPEVTADVSAVTAANRLFEAGNYGEAIQVYEQLSSQGVEDSVLFYNLGNAYYRNGDLGRAILNFRRAAELDPRDPDIRANLALASAQANDPFHEAAPGPLNSLANVTRTWLTLNETAILALGLWFLAGFGLLIIWRMEPGKFRAGVQYAWIIVILLLLISGLSLGSRIYTERTRPEGIVVAPVVAISNGPGAEYDSGINLTSGAPVKLVETQGPWARIDASDTETEKWIPLEAVETIASSAIAHGNLL
jgi:TPR repeat protein